MKPLHDPRAHPLRHHGALLLCATLGACAGSGEGLDASGRPVGENPPPSEASAFQRIQDTILTPICTQCHAGAGAPLGLRLDAGNSYAQLVNVPSVEAPNLPRVNPGDPDRSYLVQKIEGRASVGGRMPLGGPALSQEQIDLVRSWIAGGAARPDAVRETPFHVVAAIPAAGEAVAPTDRLQIVFSADVDAALADRQAVTLVASGGDGRFDDGNERKVGIAAVRVALLNPTVVTIAMDATLVPDVYRLILHGGGPAPLADVDAHVLDGDGDGRAGGDFRLQFATTAGDAP